MATSASTPPTEELGVVLREYMSVTERLQRTHETLQHEVARLRDELARKNRELEVRRRLAALGELAAGVAHEVRNPLGAIQLYSNLLRRECRRLDPALLLIDKIETGIRAIEAVVQDTLALAPRAGQLLPRPLVELIESAAECCAPVLAKRDVRLDVDISRRDVHVLADGDGLQRVLVNLIMNAVEASPPGGRVEVRCGAARRGVVVVRVLDEGTGLSPEVREHLFDPFFTTKEHGTGLGLTIAHRLVAALSGRLTARNRRPRGAVFVVTLPVAAADATSRDAIARRISAA